MESILKCQKCGLIAEPKKEVIVCSDGTERLKATCSGCGEYIKFLGREMTHPENFIMPFGKYSKQTLFEINKTDRAYLTWCSKNLDTSNVKRHIAEFLAKFP